MNEVDINRCNDAMENIIVVGCPDRRVIGRGYTASDGRLAAIEDAIAAINTDGKTALADKYIGIKNYGGFGDQREDHGYGRCPRHGTIVFRIERNRVDCQIDLGANEIFLLECVRDFPSFQDGVWPNSNNRLRHANLCDAIRKLQQARFEEETMLSHLTAFTPEPTVPATTLGLGL